MDTLDREALNALIRALESELAERENARAYAPLAEAYRLTGMLDEAVGTATRGATLFPRHVGIRVVLGRALTDAGRTSEAREAYREVITHDPENAEARTALGIRARPLAEPTAPERSADGGAADAGPAPRGHGGFREQGSLSEELAHLADLFSRPSSRETPEPDDDELAGIATLTLAEIYARQGLFTRAIEICERILERNPGDEQVSEKIEEYRQSLAAVD
jgi:tetratricopeptide (TPR) repeat protein